MRKLLKVGDVIKTNPLEGYWVGSIILSVREKSEEFNELCHIGVTNIVYSHDFEISEITDSDIEVIYTENRVGIKVPCIAVYATKIKPGIEVIGNIDISPIYGGHLAFEIGDGSDGGWPSCGDVKKSIGFEAVHQWRSINDREKWLLDIKAADKSHEEMLERLKAQCSKAT